MGQRHKTYNFNSNIELNLRVKSIQLLGGKRCREIRILIHCQWEYKMVQPFGKRFGSLAFPQMIPHRVYHVAQQSTPRWRHKRHENLYPHKILIQMCIAALHAAVKRQKKHKCSSANEWINKMWAISTVEYFLATKRNEVLIPVTWINTNKPSKHTK